MSEWTTLKVLDWTAKRFTERGLDSPRLDAQILLAHVLGCTRVQLYTGFDRPLDDAELASYRDLIKRRLAGESIAYLVGEQEFWSLAFWVDGNVLVPRRDTETLIEVVLDEIGDRGRPMRLLDVGTGSGAIAVTLARELANATVIAIDVSPAAAALAARNAERHGLASRVEVRVGDLLAPVAGEPPFDAVVANLPYIPAATIDGLAAEVRREPRLALDGGADGLEPFRHLLLGAGGRAAVATLMAPGALLALEHGFDQADAVAALIADADAFTPARTRKDMGGQPRITFASRREA